jgi:hypothetical protein
MIIALAGRRIDAVGAKAVRFPLNKIESVKEKLGTIFISLKPNALVSSGACGADLLALEVAGSMNIPRSMVLPFDQKLFRSASVTDRPGDWGNFYDKICKEVAQEEGIKVLSYPKDDDETYRKTNIDILERAEALAEKYGVPGNLVAIIVWEGKPKDKDDTTAHFKKEAEKRHFEIRTLTTK